jgi:pimeloyl-ACP methyl ester carboxylesterase
MHCAAASIAGGIVDEIGHRFVDTNGIKMHIAESGKGPLVVLCHGFPECWYSWRHQLRALAEAGYHAVAPDQRGFGQTDRPTAVDAYSMFQLVGDIVGLVHALGEEHASIVGHDWGANVASFCALLRPDMFQAVGLLSVPYVQRSWNDLRPTEALKRMAGEQQFYQLYFQVPGQAERDLEANVRRTIRCVLYSGSGDPPPEKRWRFVYPRSQTFLDTCSEPDTLPAWLTEADIDYLAAEFERTGFSGGLNWYRNIDSRWEQTPFLTGAKLRQPTLFVAGEHDAVIGMRRAAFDRLYETVPNLRNRILLPGAGHWVQQERPGEINQLLVDFLHGEASSL